MKGKRIVVSFVALLMILAAITGCTPTAEDSNSETSDTEQQQETQTTEQAQDQTSDAEDEVVQINPVNSNPLSDVRVRQALAYAIDIDAIIEGLMGGNAVAATSLVPDGFWKAAGLAEYDYNPEKARELLADAEWDPDYELDMIYYYGDQLTVDICTAIQSYLAEVGVKCSIRKIEGTVSEVVYSRPVDPVKGPATIDWDIAYAGVAAPTIFEYYTRFGSDSSVNATMPGNEKIDALLAEAGSTVDVEVQKSIFDELQQIQTDNVLLYPLYYQQYYTVESDRLTRNGAMYGNEQYVYDWDIQTWDIEPDENGEKVMRTNGAPVEVFDTTFKTPGLYITNKALFDRLIVANSDYTEFKPQLASEYNMSEDGKTISFTLKDGIKWHDGTEITADDVKFTCELGAKTVPLNALFQNLFGALEGYQDFMDGNADDISGIVIDGNKITFNLAEVYPNALISFSQLAPLPKAYLEDVDPLNLQQDEFWQFPIGSGPYKLEEVNMNDYTVMVPFEDYHDGVAIIEKIQAYPSTDSDPNLVINAAAGLVDYAFSKSVEDYLAIIDIEDMKITPADVFYTRFLYINQFPRE